jgi:hypothetical protein
MGVADDIDSVARMFDNLGLKARPASPLGQVKSLRRRR